MLEDTLTFTLGYVAWIAFQWLLLSLVAWRITKFINDDALLDDIRDPIVDASNERRWRKREAQGKKNARDAKMGKLATLITCPYCMGTWITIAVFAVADQLLDLPLVTLQVVASMAVVGMLGSTFE